MAMVPAKSDPKWARFASNFTAIKVNDLATKMFLNRLKVKATFDQSEAAKRGLIDEAYEFFTKNQENLKGDIQTIFG